MFWVRLKTYTAKGLAKQEGRARERDRGLEPLWPYLDECFRFIYCHLSSYCVLPAKNLRPSFGPPCVCPRPRPDHPAGRGNAYWRVPRGRELEREESDAIPALLSSQRQSCRFKRPIGMKNERAFHQQQHPDLFTLSLSSYTTSRTRHAATIERT